MRYLLASGRAQTRQDVAQVLGGHRNTIGHGLALSEAGGLEPWLALDVPAGQPLSRPPDGLAALEQALRQPAGLPSYEARRPWIQRTSHLDVNDHTLYTLIRPRFNAKLKGPRPRHTKTS